MTLSGPIEGSVVDANQSMEICLPKCELMYACGFYRRTAESGTGLGLLYKRAYCDKDWQRCARYVVAKALGSHCVPNDLYPNMADRAKQMLCDLPDRSVGEAFEAADS